MYVNDRYHNKHKEVWAQNKFDDWQIFCEINTSKSIDNLSKNDIRVFIDQLVFFMLKVTKIDGNIYSLMKFHYHNYFLYSY